jgi:hypothetical protein
MITAMVFASGLFFGLAAGVLRPDGEVHMRPLVVRATAPTELACMTIPLRNGRAGETVRMCEGGLPPVE